MKAAGLFPWKGTVKSIKRPGAEFPHAFLTASSSKFSSCLPTAKRKSPRKLLFFTLLKASDHNYKNDGSVISQCYITVLYHNACYF